MGCYENLYAMVGMSTGASLPKHYIDRETPFEKGMDRGKSGSLHRQ